MVRNPILGFIMLIAAGFSSQARADLIFFGLDNPVQTGSPGDTLQFNAEMAADGFTFLNGDSFSFSGPGFLDDSGLFLNFPQLFVEGDDFDGALFSYTLPVDIPSGTYLGSFSLYGGSTLDDNLFIGSQNFSVTTVNTQLSSTPEPASLALIVIGLLALGASGRRLKLRIA